MHSELPMHHVIYNSALSMIILKKDNRPTEVLLPLTACITNVIYYITEKHMSHKR